VENGGAVYAAGEGGDNAVEKQRKCTSCSTKKPESFFTIGKVTCDDCCIKKRRLSKERTKQKQSLKTSLEEVQARNAVLEEENRLLRAGKLAAPTLPEQALHVTQIERQNQALRRQLNRHQSVIAKHEARFEHIQTLVAQEAPALAPQLDCIPVEGALRDSQGLTDAYYEDIALMEMSPLEQSNPVPSPVLIGQHSLSDQMFLSEEEALAEMQTHAQSGSGSFLGGVFDMCADTFPACCESRQL